MLISYDINDKGPPTRKGWSKPLVGLAIINAIFVVAMLSAWRLVSMFVSDPLEWATWMRVHRGSNFMEVFDYPFVLLWLFPLSGIAIAWVASQSRKWSVAWMALTLPIMVLGLVFGWYYLAPPDLH